jgi:microcompartment protein CcmK/EutM
MKSPWIPSARGRRAGAAQRRLQRQARFSGPNEAIDLAVVGIVDTLSR